MAVDRPGYAGLHHTFSTKETALIAAEEFMRANAPKPPAVFTDPNQKAYVLVEETYRSGDHTAVAHWVSDYGKWKKVRGNPSKRYSATRQTGNTGYLHPRAVTNSEALRLAKRKFAGVTSVKLAGRFTDGTKVWLVKSSYPHGDPWYVSETGQDVSSYGFNDSWLK